jgi:hypothetical protein
MPIVFLLALASLFAAQQKDVDMGPPPLGSVVPKSIIAARRPLATCLTAAAHYDPCADIVSEHMSYVVAWDKATNKVVYVFTSDLSFVTDSELGIGGSVKVDRRKLIRYKDWLIAPELGDTADGEPGGAKWYPIVALLDGPSNDSNMTYASIAGFVQSDYLSTILQQNSAKTP